MPNQSDSLVSDPPDLDRVYRRYLDRCRSLGIEPVVRDRARDLIEEWNAAIAAAWKTPSIEH